VFQQLLGAIGAHGAFGAAGERRPFEDLPLVGCSQTLNTPDASVVPCARMKIMLTDTPVD
jgi:hypothetical protein